MSGLARPRGPLPSRVYWTRRALLLLVAFGLVVGISHLLGAQGGGDTSQAVDATPVGGSPTATVTATTSATGSPTVLPQTTRAERRAKALPQPDGPCADSDVVVTPRVHQANEGDPVQVVLRVTTLTSPACTWQVSPDSVFVTVSEAAGSTTLWTSQECPRTVPTQDVVARQQKAGKVVLTWVPRESDPGCTKTTPWLRKGAYRVAAVARGATDPQDSEFVLGAATAATVTETATPKATASPSGDATPSGSASPRSGAKGTATPSGSASPSGSAAPSGSASPSRGR